MLSLGNRFLRVGIFIAACGFGLARAEDDPPAPSDANATATAQLAALLTRLDSDRFSIREQAMDELAQMLARPASASDVAAELRRVWLSPETSFEVRTRLAPFVRQLDASPSDPPDEITSEEVERMLDLLASDSYAERVGAAARLKWIMRDRDSVVPIMTALKARMGADSLPEENRRRLETVWQDARGAWLMAGAPTAGLPPVSTGEIERWIDDLVSPRRSAERGNEQHVAERELLDALAREDLTEQVAAMLNERLESGDLEPDAAEKLRSIVDWTRPAMVAEYWEARSAPPARHLGIQHLFVGEPSVPEGAERASHFDAIDDSTAHCVSGNSLTPGNWPVGVAFPHPNEEAAFFHLVNLSTPRRRMAYEYSVQRDEAERLTEISRRTCDAWLAKKQPLSHRELGLLALLDARCVSELAGQYLRVVDDQALVDGSGLFQSVGQPSHHAALCFVLAAVGTHDAADGLMSAIENDRILPPSPQSPYRWPWIAALAIAKRDPWPEADSWLASVVSSDVALRSDASSKPAELGATAAAILASRRGAPSVRRELEPVGDEVLSELGCPAYRFSSPDGRARALAWCASIQRSAGKAPATTQTSSKRR